MLESIVRTSTNREEQLALIELIAQLFCEQIHRDYEQYISNRVLPRLPHGLEMGWREIRVLGYLNAARQPLSPSVVAKNMNLNPGTITRGIQDLNERGYIDMTEGFRKKLSVTAEGRAWVAGFGKKFLNSINAAEKETQLVLSGSVAEEILDLLIVLRDRSELLGNLNFGKVQKAETVLRKKKDQAVSREQRLMFYDYTVERMSSQISKNYKRFIEKHVMSNMPALSRVNIRDLRVLMAVNYYNEPVTPQEIAEVLRFDPATLSRSTKALEKNNLIYREYDNGDNRSFDMMLTDLGKETATTYQSVAHDVLERAEAHLGLPRIKRNADLILDTLNFAKSRSMAFAELRPVDAIKVARPA